jgi:hypothetical protein
MSVPPLPPAPRTVRSKGEWAARLFVPLLGSTLCLLMTRRGPLIGQDAAAYLGAANNLLHGRGLTTPFDLSGSQLSPSQVFAFHGAVPLVHFPPLYPLVLATLSAPGFDMANAARWLNAALLGGTLLVFELLVARLSTSRLVLPMSAAALLLAGPAVFFHQDLLLITTGVASDPLLLFVFLLGVLLVDHYLEHPTRGLFLGMVACAALAPCIRYAGIGFVLAASLVLAWWSHPERHRRWSSALVVLLSGTVPVGIWSLVVTYVMHGESVRSFAVHPVHDLVQGIVNIGSGWFLPASLADGVRWTIFVLLLLFTGFAVLRLRGRTDAGPGFERVAAVAVFAGVYLGVVVITREYLDATTPIDNRILLPMLPLLYLLVIAGLASECRNLSWGPLLIGGLCLLLAATNVRPSLALINEVPRGTSANPAVMPTMDAIDRLPAGTLIVSGIPDLIYTDTGRSSIRVPVRTEGTTDRANQEFELQLRQLAHLLTDHHGVWVVIPGAASDFVPTGATVQDLRPFAHVRVLSVLPGGGTIYAVTA